MFKSDGLFINIIISEQAIKVAQVTGGGVVQKIARREAAGLSGDPLVKALRATLAGFSVNQATVVCSIPASVATTKNIEIPSVDPQEIQSIISLQAGRHTPFSRDEILIGFINLGAFQANYTKVLLVIVNRNIVKERLATLAAAGVVADKVLFAPEGIARFYGKILNIKKDLSPLGIIDIGAQATNFVVASRGTVLTCRSIPVGIKQLETGAIEERDKLVAELVKSAEAYRDEDVDRPIVSYIVTSDHNAVKDLKPVLTDALKADVQSNSFVTALKAGGAVKKKIQTEFLSDSYLEVVGPAAFGNKSEIDLMPEEIQMQRSLEQEGKQTTLAGILAVTILVLIGAILLARVYFKDAFLSNLHEKYADQRAEVQTLEKQLTKTKAIREYMNKRMVGLEAIRELYTLTPKEIYLQTISMDDQGEVSITGISESMSRVFSFVSAIEDSSLFKGVKTKSTSTRKDRGKDVAAFEVAFKIDEQAEENPRPVKQKTVKLQNTSAADVTAVPTAVVPSADQSEGVQGGTP